MRWLPPGLVERLRVEPPAVRARVEGLAAERAATRLAALDGLFAELLGAGDPTEGAPTLLPYALALASAPGYPQSAALLLRVAQLLAAIDTPPRALAADVGTERARRTYDAVEAHGARLVELARSSSDPSVARLAAALAGRFPSLDEALAPVLLALVSGAPDPDEAAPVLYALARVQLARGEALHRRLAEALSETPPGPRAVAVALALLDGGDPPPHEVERLRATVRAASEGALDPRAPGRRLEPPSPD